MTRGARVWFLYALCVAAAAAALAGVTWSALATERAGTEANRQAALEGAARVALYRMDSQLASLIGAEAGRPVLDYLRPIAVPASATPPSGFLTAESRFVRLYFVMRDKESLAVNDASAGPIANNFQSRIQYSALMQAVGRAEEDVARQVASLPATLTPGSLQNEWQNRAQSNVQMLQTNMVQQQAIAKPELRPGLMAPVWCQDQLLLVRRVEAGGSDEQIQGCWLDWDALRATLEHSVSDLLPEARLLPVLADSKAQVIDERRLASLPAYLVPGPLPTGTQDEASPLRITLLIAWVCGALAAVAVGGLLGAALALSERRATFVSAVTHEMRTPLTTFRLYTDLLAEGNITGDEKRQRYYETLRAEAVRLGHLVENVLAYARIERHRGPRALEPAHVRDAFDHVLDSLVQRAAQAGRELKLEGDDEALSATVHIDGSAFERILMNLVDNACKHGTPAKDPLIQVRVSREGRWITVRVMDSGPGVPTEVAPRLFRAFGRSARDAAGAAPGIGLGLALSHRLARRMRGDLRLDRHYHEGACFVLRLPPHASLERRGG